MSTVVPYKGLQILSPDPSGEGGALIQNNFKAIADELQILAGKTDIDSSVGGGGVDPDSVTTQNIISTGFTLSHNNKKILNLTSDGNTYVAANIDPGNAIGQRLLITIFPATDADIHIPRGTTNTNVLGRWYRNQRDETFSWLLLQWDGTQWNELARDHNYNTSANNLFSDATGDNTIADGYAATAMGFASIAGATASVAEGNSTTAGGDGAHSEGAGTSATGSNSHAEGTSSNAGYYPDNFNISGTLVTIFGDVRSRYHQGNNLHFFELFGGTNNVMISQDQQIADTPAFGGGNTTFNLNSPLDDRVGGMVVNLNRGNAAHAEGINTNAIGNGAHSEGQSAFAFGDASHAEGGGSAYGNSAHGEGNATAYGDNSHAEGGSQANGSGAHAEGQGTASSASSHAEGFSTASSQFAHAEGFGSQAGSQPDAWTFTGKGITISGNVTHKYNQNDSILLYQLAGGIDNQVYNQETFITSPPLFSGGETSFSINQNPGDRTSGQITNYTQNRNAHAEGNSVARATSAHSEGESTQALADASHAEGTANIVTGASGHGEGSGNSIRGINAHAENQGNQAIADSCHVENFGNICTMLNGHVEGDTCRVGYQTRAFTISGSTVTIAGVDVTTEFLNGDTIRFWNLSGGTNGILDRADRTIASNAIFSGDTTFDISSPLDDRTGGICVDVTAKEAAHAEGALSVATGYYAHAEGEATQALADFTHSEGDHTIASAIRAHAEGHTTTASGDTAHAEGHSTLASGQFSHAQGDGCQATNYTSHAEGQSTTSSGESSHAEGASTNASGDKAHAEGRDSIASSEASHAEGISTQASGPASHAEGNACQASNNNAHAEGSSTIASGDSSHAEGGQSNATGSFSHAEGALTTAFGIRSHAEGNSTNAAGDSSHAEGQSSITGPQTVASHAEGSGSIAAGATGCHAEGDRSDSWGTASHSEGRARAIGDHSHAEGGDDNSRVTVNRVIAAGHQSHAEGSQTNAGNFPRKVSVSGGIITITNESVPGDFTAEFPNSSTARFIDTTSNIASDSSVVSSNFDGVNTTIVLDPTIANGSQGYVVVPQFGSNSHAEGQQTQTSGTASHAEGNSSSATGSYAHAEGDSTIASNSQSHAEGQNSQASGVSSHAEGSSTQATALASHAEGSSTQATALASHAEGAGSVASGTKSHAEGDSSTASGSTSHAEGHTCSATNNNTHAEGNNSTASGNTSHAEGNSCTASADFSHAEGDSSVANGPTSHVQGTQAKTSANSTGWHAEANGMFATPGDAQYVRQLLRAHTTDANPHQLQTPDQFWLTPDSLLETAYAVTLTVFAKEQAGGGGGRAMWKRMFIIDTSTTNLYGDPDPIGTDIAFSAAGWTMTIVNPTNSTNIQILVNGNGANVNWVALIEAVQISG